jgi:hypothetical protein
MEAAGCERFSRAGLGAGRWGPDPGHVRPEDVAPSSPYRLPHWRWALAQHLVASPRSRLRHLADGPVRRAVAYLRARDRGLIQARSADVRAAATLWGAVASPRLEIEARLLAGEEDRAIAARCGLAPEVVAAYADLFYDVRPRLGVRSYVLHQVIGPVAPSAGSPADPSRVLKRLAHQGGPAVLDALLVVARGAGPAATAGLLGLLLEVIDLPTDGPEALRVVRLYDQMRRIDDEAAGRSASSVFRPVYDADEVRPPGSAVARAGAVPISARDPVVPAPVTAGSDEPGHSDGPSPTVVVATKSA